MCQFLDNARAIWLLRLIPSLPVNVCDKSWCADTPPYLKKTSEQLQKLCLLQLSRRYRARLTPERKSQLSEKLVASEVRDHACALIRLFVCWLC